MAVNLLDFDLEGLAAYCESLGEKRFRAVQLYRWIHQKGESDFEKMSDLARSLRGKLSGAAEVRGLPLGEIERRRPADRVLEIAVHLGLERRIGLGVGIGFFEIEDQRHQRFGDEASAENAEMPALVGAGAE